MEFRRTMGYPPAAALVNVIVRATDAAKGAAEAAALAARAARGGRGPLPRARPGRTRRSRGCASEHRFQILLKGHRPAMREAVRAALVARYGAQRWPGVAVDVDPLSVM